MRRWRARARRAAAELPCKQRCSLRGLGLGAGLYPSRFVLVGGSLGFVACGPACQGHRPSGQGVEPCNSSRCARLQILEQVK
jgi:hypothetical protein